MTRVTFYLNEREYESLQKIAKDRKKSIYKIMREAVKELLKASEPNQVLDPVLSDP